MSSGNSRSEDDDGQSTWWYGWLVMVPDVLAVSLVVGAFSADVFGFIWIALGLLLAVAPGIRWFVETGKSAAVSLGIRCMPFAVGLGIIAAIGWAADQGVVTSGDGGVGIAIFGLYLGGAVFVVGFVIVLVVDWFVLCRCRPKEKPL